MKQTAYIRFSITLFLLFALLSPTAVLAGGNGKKHFKKGMNHEVAEEWDQAVEEFSMAIAENPSNPEYRLHYRRSLFNASQMFMIRGKALAAEEDFAGAYIAFRRSYGYDPVNELARSEMERMLRLQRAKVGGDNPDDPTAPAGGQVNLVQTTYRGVVLPDDVTIPQRLERYRDVLFPTPVDLQRTIKNLATDLDLNVLFDTESRLESRKISIELKNVTSAKALDYIFLQENLFFQKVGPRTILVAAGNRRQNFQQLVLRTYYLSNASPKDVANVVKTAIPAQPGRTPTIVLTDDATNSITIRDTSENIRLIGKLITSLDKDRAEVVMDVQIFEVSKNDLLQLGNQIGSGTSLVNLGGTTSGVVGIGGNDIYNSVGRAAADILPTAIGAGLILPAANLQAFQSKQNTKLIASTQIHAFNNEDSSARIGQRVPVRTASFAPVGNTTGGNTNNFVGDVINYEQTGLTLKFKPIVFPNEDVQVTMEIESKEVQGVTDENLNPTFTERTIKGTARIQNNKTLLLASVAQGVESNGRSGLPILGLIPILGRLFTAPKNENRQIDVVIAVTPRVIRAPNILPEDLEERETGSLAVPTSSSLEAMIIQEEIEEQLAAARRLGNTARVQLPDQPLDQPAYVRSDSRNAPVNETGAVSVRTQNNVDGSAREVTAGLPGVDLNTVRQDLNYAETYPVEVPAREPVKQEKIKNSEYEVSLTRNFSSPELLEVYLPSRFNVYQVLAAPVREAAFSPTVREEASRSVNPAQQIQPIDTSVKTLQIRPASDVVSGPINPQQLRNPVPRQAETRSDGDFVEAIRNQAYTLPDIGGASLQMLPGIREMRAGEKTRIAVILRSPSPFRSAVLGLKFDPQKLSVKSVAFGDLFGTEFAHKTVTPFLNQDGKMYVTLSVSKDIRGNNSGVLAYIEIEAKTSGSQAIYFDEEAINFMTARGEIIAVSF